MNVTTATYQYMNMVDEDYITEEIQETNKPEVKQNISPAAAQENTYGSDTFESVPEIEHYNNYSKNGMLNTDSNKQLTRNERRELERGSILGKAYTTTVTSAFGDVTTYTISEDNMLMCDLRDAFGTKITNRYSEDGTLIIDMRNRADAYETWGDKHIRIRFPVDIHDDWEVLSISTNIFGETITQKRPSEQYRIIILDSGPLSVRHEYEITSINFDENGRQVGYRSKEINFDKRIELQRLLWYENIRINEIASQGVKDFINGKIDADEVSKVVETIYNELVALSIALGNTDGNCPKINAEILREAQIIFSRQALNETFAANWDEGREYAKTNFGITNSSFMYYNARFYHLNEQLQEIGRTATTQIAKDNGLEFNAHDIHRVFSEVHKAFCFNARWQNFGYNMGMSVMKDITLVPPEDFIMFYAPSLISKDAWAESTIEFITIKHPLFPNGLKFHLQVPKGKSLFKNKPLWAKQGSFTNHDGKTFVTWDITKHLNFNSGDDYISQIKEFFAKYVNNFNMGVLTISSGGIKTVHDVPFGMHVGGDVLNGLSFGSKEMFHGHQLKSAVEHSSFMSNFEFHIWSDFIHKSQSDLYQIR